LTVKLSRRLVLPDPALPEFGPPSPLLERFASVSLYEDWSVGEPLLAATVKRM
jgi:hypothetical protein